MSSKRDGGPPEPPSPTPDPATTKQPKSVARIQTGSDSGRSRARAARLAKLIPGADPGLIAALAALPLADLDLIVKALRQARRDGIAHEKAVRAQRRDDARKYHHYDVTDLADRTDKFRLNRSFHQDGAA